MIKDGTIILTQGDLDAYKRGEVSERIQEIWALTYQELREIIQSSNYQLLQESKNVS